MLDGRCPVDLDGNGTGVIRWWCSAAAARVGQGHARMVHAILAFRCEAGSAIGLMPADLLGSVINCVVAISDTS